MNKLAFGIAEQVTAEGLPIPARLPELWAPPTKGIRSALVQAQWPLWERAVRVNHEASTDSRGWHRPARSQLLTLTFVPVLWLERFAQLQGFEVKAFIRGDVDG